MVRQTAFIVAVAIVVDVALFFLFGGVHRGLRPARFILITQGGAGLVALAMLVGAFGRGRSMLGPSMRRLLWIAAATPILLLSWTLVWNALYPEAVIADPERIGLRCFAFSLVVAAWPLVLIARVRREKNPIAPAAAGAARGAAVGALAWVLVGLWCPLTNLPHLALGHFLPLLVLCAVGGWLGKQLMSVDGQSPVLPKK